MDKLNTLSIGVSAAISAAILSALCAAAFILWPDATIEFFNSWMRDRLRRSRSAGFSTV